MHFDLIITRHSALREYLAELGHTADAVLEHESSPEALDGKHVCGVLPMHLAARCASVTVVPLDFGRDANLRGVELTLEQVRAMALPIETYVVLSASTINLPYLESTYGGVRAALRHT